MPAPDRILPSRPAVPAQVRAVLLAHVRECLAADASWRTFTHDQKRWVCPWCLSAVARRHQKSWEDSLTQHLESCRNYGGGRMAQQPTASVQAQLAFENMVCTAENDPAWGVFDAQGCWICPACLERVAEARLAQGARNGLMYRAMALHLQRCQAFANGQMNAASIVRAAREHPAPAGSGSGGTRSTTQLALPTRREPSNTNLPIARAVAAEPPVAQRTPSQANIPIALPVEGQRQPSSTGVPIVPGTQPIRPGTASFSRQRRGVSSGEIPAVPAAAAPMAPPVAYPAEKQPAQADLGWMDAADQDAAAAPAAPESIERTDLIRARDLQKKMLAAAPTLPGYRFATRYEPCDHITGDFFSFVNLVDGRLGFAIGDVSGHGMQAGLIMTMAKKTIEIYGELVGDPAEVLAKVNEALVGDLSGRMFVSVTYGILSPSERTIHWARAGHNPTFAFNIHNHDLAEIKPGGMVLGMKAGQTFRDCLQVETTQLRDGDTFLLYTDGVTETHNTQGEEFQTERLKSVIAQYASDGPDVLLTQVMDRIRHFRGAQPVADDITLLALSVG